MSSYKLIILDRRFNGAGIYDYMIEPAWGDHTGTRQTRFLIWRDWLWTTFGIGCELAMVNYMPAKPQWAWDTSYNNLRLYLSKEELVMFKLKF